MNIQAHIATNGLWFLTFDRDGVEVQWPHYFSSENQALLFAAMNSKLLK